MTGFGQSAMACHRRCTCRRCMSMAEHSAISRRSAPAAKTSPPPGQHDAADVRITTQNIEMFGQLAANTLVEGIFDFRTVQAEKRDAVARSTQDYRILFGLHCGTQARKMDKVGTVTKTETLVKTVIFCSFLFSTNEFGGFSSCKEKIRNNLSWFALRIAILK